MIVQSIKFRDEFRSFQEGTEIEFKDRTTVLVGDNGAGKSTLIGLIREHFDTHWTPSALPGLHNKEILAITPRIEPGTPLTYVDLATDLMTTRSEFDSNHPDLQIALKWKSSGQASLLQFSQILQKSKARIHIIDEPERGLSPGKQIVMASVLKEIIEERADEQFIVVTHSPQFMKALSNRVLVLPSAEYMDHETYLRDMEFHGRQQARKYLEARRSEMAAAEKE